MARIRGWVCLGLLLPAAALRAEVKCASLFGDHMVLQRDAPVPVWGTADAGEEVVVRVGGQRHTASADDKGRWALKLGPLPAGGPVVLEVSGKNALKFEDVLVGDVWVCSGQSNMSFAVRRADRAKEEIAAADHPQIRLFTVLRKTSPRPLDAVQARWDVCSPKTVEGFTAVGYFFGRDLQRELGVPVALIHTSWGGTLAEAWTDAATLREDPDFAPILRRGEDYPGQYPKLREQYEAKVRAARAKDAKAPLPRSLRSPAPPELNPNLPSVLYNAMVAPLEPFAIKGVIWYQGESNASRAYQYRKLLPAMIRGWRRAWGQGDFPFLIVQLANFGKNSSDGSSAWAELREAQELTARRLPHCGIAVTIDIGNPADVHPTDKQDVGKRLALAAERLVYGRDVVASGPAYRAMAVKGRVVRVKFDRVGDGLVAKGGKVEGFSVAGADQKFEPADAKIEGDEVVVSSPSVARPAAVRYGWANSPTCTLYNQAGLPALPFRSDDWKATTAGAK